MVEPFIIGEVPPFLSASIAWKNQRSHPGRIVKDPTGPERAATVVQTPSLHNEERIPRTTPAPMFIEHAPALVIEPKVGPCSTPIITAEAMIAAAQTPEPKLSSDIHGAIVSSEPGQRAHGLPKGSTLTPRQQFDAAQREERRRAWERTSGKA